MKSELSSVSDGMTENGAINKKEFRKREFRKTSAPQPLSRKTILIARTSTRRLKQMITHRSSNGVIARAALRKSELLPVGYETERNKAAVRMMRREFADGAATPKPG
jgi:hypothetical protein